MSINIYGWLVDGRDTNGISLNIEYEFKLDCTQRFIFKNKCELIPKSFDGMQ